MRQLCSFCFLLHWFLVFLSFRCHRNVNLFCVLHLFVLLICFSSRLSPFTSQSFVFALYCCFCCVRIILFLRAWHLFQYCYYIFALHPGRTFIRQYLRTWILDYGLTIWTENVQNGKWVVFKMLVPFYFKIKYGPHSAEQTIHEVCLITRWVSTRLVHFEKIFMFIAFHCLMRHNNVCILWPTH